MSFPYSLPLLLDGATATNLTAAGMPAGVCVEQWICDHPDSLLAIQRGFVEAGSQALYAPTFGASAFHLKEFGLEAHLEEINRRLVEITRSVACFTGIPVGGSLGPSGLFTAPLGDADFDDIYDGYRQQVRALEDAGVDFLVLETQNSLADMRAGMLAARTTNLPVFVTITVDDSGHTISEGNLLSTVIVLQAMGADAIGLNCCSGPAMMLPLIEEIAPHASVPIIAKPNAGIAMWGSPQDAGYLSPSAFAAEMRALMQAGAVTVGGCCGATPAHIAALKQEMELFSEHPELLRTRYEDADCYAAAIEREVFFLGDNIVFSEPIACTSGLDDDLIDLDDEQVNAALVELENMDDVTLLLEHSDMTKLPIAIRTDNPTVLDAALRYFQGRLIVDTDCMIDNDLIEQLGSKYGAIIY